jgi:hypothetical protein
MIQYLGRRSRKPGNMGIRDFVARLDLEHGYFTVLHADLYLHEIDYMV